MSSVNQNVKEFRKRYRKCYCIDRETKQRQWMSNQSYTGNIGENPKVSPSTINWNILRQKAGNKWIAGSVPLRGQQAPIFTPKLFLTIVTLSEGMLEKVLTYHLSLKKGRAKLKHWCPKCGSIRITYELVWNANSTESETLDMRPSNLYLVF